MITAITLHHKASCKKPQKYRLQAKLCILFAFGLISTPIVSYAQTDNSLSSLSNINKVIQDKRGFIWISGQHGLTRVDSSSTINFSLNNQQWPLPFSWIHDVNLLDDKLLLATETDGLWLFNTLNGAVKKLNIETPKQSYYKTTVFKKNYYVYAPDKFYKFNPSNQVTTVIDHNISISKQANTESQLYVANNKGLFKLENELLIKVIDQPITALKALPDAVIAITPDKIIRLNDEGDQTSTLHQEEIHGLTKAFDSDSFFTINNRGVIKKYHAETLAQLSHHYGKAKAVHYRTAFHDASGVLWLSSSHGLQQLSESYVTNHPVVFDIPINANEITLFENDIIIGSYGAGLQNFLEPVFDLKINDNFTKKGLKVFDVLAVNNVLYIGSLDGLWRFDKDTKQLTKLDVIGNKLVLKLEINNNQLYIATNDDGLYIYDLTSKEVIKHINTDDGLASAEVIDVLPLDNDKLWLATSSRISYYQEATNKVTTFDTPNKSKIISLVFADSKIFASTLGDGILVFNQQGDLLAQLSKGHSFTEMLLINDEIWISGKPGLYRLSPKNYQITMIENTQQYSFVSSMLVKNNTLYAIHYSGVLALNLSKQKQYNPKVVISKTTISGRSYLLNKTIKVASGNDVITLDLASLDYRPGLRKKFQYRINNSQWQQMNNSQLTLTGLASGHYSIEVMATNSLGQWSDIKAYTEIDVAYPWYWTIELRIIYGVIALALLLLTAWLLLLRAKSIKHIHNLLQDDMSNCGRAMKVIQRNLHLAAASLANNEISQSKQLIEQSLLEIKNNAISAEPDNLAGKKLADAIEFFVDHVKAKYQIQLQSSCDTNVEQLPYELKADVYKVIFEAIMSATFKGDANRFKLTLKEVKNKLWLTIHSDCVSFEQLESKVDFDLASYTIRQITTKHQASLNTFENDDGSSQLVISFPLMQLN